MILKQYIVTLPSDYDMGIIRERVVSKGPAFDSFPGLGLKGADTDDTGRVFRFEAGHRSDAKPDTVPTRSRTAFRFEAGRDEGAPAGQG